ncbi:hypothetical protein [Achromobacter sp. RTa]|nr:hypothetical protein [Achromobacter sp. RTa]
MAAPLVSLDTGGDAYPLMAVPQEYGQHFQDLLDAAAIRPGM